jgi:glutathione S-transferase
MSGIVVHGIPASPYLRAVAMTLNEKKLPWRLAAIKPGENRLPEHLARQPFGKVPALEHDDFVLYETQAILRYLDAVFPQPALRPSDLRTLARMDQMIGIVDCYFFRNIAATIVFNRIVAPMLGLPVDEAVIAAAIPNTKLCLGVCEGFLGDAPFLIGDALTLADLMLAPQLAFLVMTPEGAALAPDYPRLRRWLSRMQERESMRNSAPDCLAAKV